MYYVHCADPLTDTNRMATAWTKLARAVTYVSSIPLPVSENKKTCCTCLSSFTIMNGGKYWLFQASIITKRNTKKCAKKERGWVTYPKNVHLGKS